MKYNGKEVNVVFTFPEGEWLHGHCTIETPDGWSKYLGRQDEQKFMSDNRKYKYVPVNQLTK